MTGDKSVLDHELKLLSVLVVADAGKAPELRDINSFAWDFNLLYELQLLSDLDPERLEFNHSLWILTRSGRPIPSRLRLSVASASFGSPLSYLLKVALTPLTAGAFAKVSKSLQKVYQTEEDPRLKTARAQSYEALARLRDAEVRFLEARTEAQYLHNMDDITRSIVGHSGGKSYLPERGHHDPIRTVELRLAKTDVRVIDIEVDIDEKQVE